MLHPIDPIIWIIQSPYSLQLIPAPARDHVLSLEILAKVYMASIVREIARKEDCNGAATVEEVDGDVCVVGWEEEGIDVVQCGVESAEVFGLPRQVALLNGAELRIGKQDEGS
jgi:hypothetical protein